MFSPRFQFHVDIAFPSGFVTNFKFVAFDQEFRNYLSSP